MREFFVVIGAKLFTTLKALTGFVCEFLLIGAKLFTYLKTHNYSHMNNNGNEMRVGVLCVIFFSYWCQIVALSQFRF